MKQFLVFWRTALVVMFLAVVLLVALLICAHWKLGAEYFGHAVTCLVGLAIVAAGHSSVQHLADGGGLMGSVKALFTAAKPAEPAQGAPP